MSPEVISHCFTAFGGARCEIRSHDGEELAVSAAVEDTYTFEQTLTRFDPASELSRFNASPGRPVMVSPLLEALLRATLDAYEDTDGLVNAAIGPALVAAGYDRTITALARTAPKIGAPVVVPALPDVLAVGKGWAQLRRGCAIDLGGVGKGWLADTLSERFDNAVVNLGGDLRVRGSGEDGGGWLVQMCDGTHLRLTDGGVATSGIGNRRWTGGHHLIDPRTGAPSATDIEAVSVAASTALRAEVLAKAAILVGADQARQWLKRHGVQSFATLAAVAA